MQRDAGSYRDSRGHIYQRDGRVFRTIHRSAEDDYRFLRDSGLLDRLVERGALIGATEVDGVDRQALTDAAGEPVVAVVEHPRVPFVSYPYEWCFGALRRAALFHLDFHRDLLDAGATLSDATAYNVQFLGARPVFIDLLSLQRYHDGDLWKGQRQFCEQFLNPLLLTSRLGIDVQPLYRGQVEGVPGSLAMRLLPWYRLLGWTTLSHVVMPELIQRRVRDSEATARRIQGRGLPLAALKAMLRQLHGFVAALPPPRRAATVWQTYGSEHGYADQDYQAKHAAIGEFVSQRRPNLVFDIGCNDGDYSARALSAGARFVVGFDADAGTVDRAFARAERDDLAFLPLVMDAANPSPGLGWAQRERRGLMERGPADALLALALVHHLAVGRNVPLPWVVDWLVGLAPCGVIEFVPPDDPMVRRLAALKDAAVLAGYDETIFAAALAARARIVRTVDLPGKGRRLYVYDRR